MKILGLILVLLPFVVISIFIIREIGWKFFFIVLGFIILIFASLTLGVSLLF